VKFEVSADEIENEATDALVDSSAEDIEIEGELDEPVEE
jgi:hypothetical protein